MSSVATRRVRLLYFAWVREKIGCPEESVDLPGNVATVADLVDWLKERGPQYGDAFSRPQVVRAALDRVHVKPSAQLGAAREIAFFPPVTGG
jgi:molybdopterin synthase sulfur carrier subunit